MKKVFLIIFSFVVLLSYYSSTTKSATAKEKEKFYIKKVLSNNITESHDKNTNVSAVIGCKGNHFCLEQDPLYIIFIFSEKDIIFYDKMVLEVPDGYETDIFGSLNLKGYGTIPFLIIAEKEIVNGFPSIMELLVPGFMEYGSDFLDALGKKLQETKE